MEEQLKLAHKVFDVVDWPNRKICVTMPRYRVDKPENSYAQVRLFARKKEGEKFQEMFYLIYKLEEFTYLRDVTNSENNNVIANTHICNFLKELIALIYSLSIFFLFQSGWVGTLYIIETPFSSWNQKWDFIMLYLQFQKLLSKNSN